MQIKSANKTWIDLVQESIKMSMSQADWSTGNKYSAFSSPMVESHNAEAIFAEVVQVKPGLSVYRVGCSVNGDRAEAEYSMEAPKPVKKTKAKKAKKVTEEE